MTEFRFRLLGPVRAWRGDTELDVGPPQQQAVLAVLLLSRGDHVSMAAMLDALWGERPPKSGAGAVRTYVSRLRQILNGAPGAGAGMAIEPILNGVPGTGIAIEPIGDGYTLRGERLSVDVDVFEERVGAALAARRDGAEAAELCREALAEWRGVPLVGVPGPYFEPVRARMIEMRADAAEIEAAGQVEVGEHLAAIASLRALITSYPLRESLHELLMLALYRAGRQADALDVYECARRILRDELGIEPGPSLKRMHQRVLRADDALVPAAVRALQPTRRGAARTADRVERLEPLEHSDRLGHSERVERLDRLEALSRQLVKAGGTNSRLVTARARPGSRHATLAVRGGSDFGEFGEFGETSAAVGTLGNPSYADGGQEDGPGPWDPRRDPARIPAQRSEPHPLNRKEPRLASHLRDARRRAFVGRERELAAFRAALADTTRPFTLLFLTGPGGIGKSTLLRRFAHEATEAGHPVVALDGSRADERTPNHFETAARRMLDGPLPDGVLPPGSPDRAVLLVDDFELYHHLESWLREDFLPRLPLGSVVVFAGRRRPARDWRTDAAWHGILESIELAELTERDAASLLAARAVPDSRRKSVLNFAGGHPLALCLAADAARNENKNENEFGAEAWLPSQEVIGTLVAHLVGDVPSAAHRQALEVCALLPTTNEASLRTALPDVDAGSLFSWLRELPFIVSGPHGLHPHDVVRTILDADLRWRDPERHQDLRNRILSCTGDTHTGAGLHHPRAADPFRPTSAVSVASPAVAVDAFDAVAAGGTSVPSAASILAREDFNSAVRSALRAWHRPDTLARSPLAYPGVIPGDDGDVASAEGIRAAIGSALLTLRADRHGEKQYLAVAATYLDADAKQQHAAADELGLPFGTYRRHLAQGLDRVCELLWHRRRSSAASATTD